MRGAAPVATTNPSTAPRIPQKPFDSSDPPSPTITRNIRDQSPVRRRNSSRLFSRGGSRVLGLGLGLSKRGGSFSAPWPVLDSPRHSSRLPPRSAPAPAPASVPRPPPPPSPMPSGTGSKRKSTSHEDISSQAPQPKMRKTSSTDEEARRLMGRQVKWELGRGRGGEMEADMNIEEEEEEEEEEEGEGEEEGFEVGELEDYGREFRDASWRELRGIFVHEGLK